MAEYASNAKGNAGLTLGIIGTTLGALSGAGGLAGVLGFGQKPVDPGDKPVTRYEMGLMNENRDLRDELVLLKANSHADNGDFALQRQIDGQGAVNAAVTATLNNQQRQIDEITSVTRRFVPNENVAPGWGRANVQPAPALPPYYMPWFPPIPGYPPYPPYPPAQQNSTTTTPDAASSTTGG